ncbi:MAG TPA: hypothetical protein DDW19_00860 [Anaerolineaceae bacterium]|jgi:hypothetical protein|nr:hypothetical protein [Anaerolineaceae bacterium]
MPVIGQDCHVTLSHPAINGGNAYGFLLNEEPGGSSRPGGVQITRQVSSDGSILVWVLFDVVLADHAINPDGSAHAKSRMQDYNMLMSYLAQQSDLILTTPMGAIVNLFAIGFTADERHLPYSSLVKCQLNNSGIYFPPVDANTLNLSVWDGTLTWETSYWR